MNGQLCASSRCRDIGMHWQECGLPGCHGCYPRMAVGGRLCVQDRDLLGRNAEEAAGLWMILEQDLANTGSGGTGGSSSNPFPSVSFNGSVSKARATIRSTLTAWCNLISADFSLPPAEPATWRLEHLPRGVQGPRNQLPYQEIGIAYLGAYIHNHRGKLARHELAGQASEDLAALVHIGTSRQQHNDTATLDVGVCPLCPAPLKALVRRNSSVPTESYCTSSENPHRWTGELQIAELGRLVGARDGWLTAKEASRRYNRPVGTIQRWASLHQWRRTRDGQRPTLYHPDDIRDTFARLSIGAAA